MHIKDVEILFIQLLKKKKREKKKKNFFNQALQMYLHPLLCVQKQSTYAETCLF